MKGFTLTNIIPEFDIYMGYEFLPNEEVHSDMFLANISFPVSKDEAFELKDTLISMICHLLIFREDIHFHRPDITYVFKEKTFIAKISGIKREDVENIRKTSSDYYEPNKK